MSRLTQTFAHIMEHLPIDLARIVEAYIIPAFLSAEALAEAGYYELVVTSGSFDQGLRGACRSGHDELAQMMLKLGGDPKYGLYGACEGGHVALVDALMTRYPMLIDNAGAIWAACRAEHRDVIHIMMKYGATVCPCGKSLYQH